MRGGQAGWAFRETLNHASARDEKGRSAADKEVRPQLRKEHPEYSKVDMAARRLLIFCVGVQKRLCRRSTLDFHKQADEMSSTTLDGS
jgi:hypothetical protein